MSAVTEMPPTEEKPGSAMNVDSTLWPNLGGENKDASKDLDNNVVDNGDWEFVSEASSQGSNEDIVVSNSTPQFFHKSTSSPALSIYEHVSNESEEKKTPEGDDESSFDHCSCSVMSIEAHSVQTESSSSHVLVSHITPEKPLTRRVPSFKDAILLNAQETEKEEVAALQRRQDAKIALRKEALAKRKASKPRLLVVKTPPKLSRNSKSTGDLNSLMHSHATIYEDHEDDMCGGGGGGGGGFDTVQEHDILGDTDATDFYAQKSKGGSSRMNSKKIRPDEAKRLDMILNKKEEQRKKQKERELELSSGRRNKTPNKKTKGR
jgi:hypothetical protein